MPVAISESPSCPHVCWLGQKLGVLMIPLYVDNFSEISKMVTKVYQIIIKDMIKEPEQGKVQKGPSPGTSVLVELGCIVFPTHGYIHQSHRPRSSLNPVGYGFLWRLYHAGLISYWLPFSSEDGVRLKGLSCSSWLDLVTQLPSVNTPSHLIRTKDAPGTPVTQDITRVLGTLY